MSSGCLPGSTYMSFTFSMAAFQSSPKPISRAAFFTSLRLNAYSRSAIAISSSAVYGIISCAQISREAVGTDRIADDRSGIRISRRWAARTGRGGDHLARNSHHALADGGRVTCDGGVQCLVRIRHPPAEHRVVAAVEAVPCGERAAHLIQSFRSAVGDGPRGPRRCRTCSAPGVTARRRFEEGAQAVDLLRHRRDLPCRLFRLRRLQVATGIVQRQQRITERQQRLHFAALHVLPVCQIELVTQVVVEQDVVELPFVRKAIEVQRPQPGAPRRVEAAHPRALIGRIVGVVAP